MASYRFIAVSVALIFVSYASVQWLLTPRQLMPDPRMPSFHRIGTSDDPRLNQPNDTDGDEVRDNLRRNALTAAEELQKNPCNDQLRDRYIAAVTSYARAWLSIATCYPDCLATRKGEDLLDRAKNAFDTRFDHRVESAMWEVHNTDTIRKGDFTPDVVLWVSARARDPLLNPKADAAVHKQARDSRAPLSCRP